jgi:peptidoglycan/xylan/chitin deacetylase (PgdA/CDA1 family)
MHHHIRDFEKEIPYLKKHYQVLPMDEVVARIKSGKGFDRPTVAITFDDGYRDNFTLAYPVLQRHGVPATIYLATSLIGSEGRTWTDQIEHVLLQTQREYFSLPELYGEKKISIKTKGEKQAVCIELADRLKSMPDTSRKEILHSIFKNLGVNGGAQSESGPRMMLRWDEVRKMAGNGITFGSHGHTHQILSKMPLQAAKEEILISKRIIEEQLGLEVRHFAYPNGRAEDFSEELRRHCAEIGCDSVASVIYGSNNGVCGNKYSLRRISAISPIWLLPGRVSKLILKN